jgi:2-polyprenyl-3-methyl-5-hydroxy-6-metoxy-1,4-benzoquinol methylase
VSLRTIRTHLGRIWRQRIKRLKHPVKTRAELHRYWYAPDDRRNAPECYLDARAHARSKMLVALVERHASPGTRILEIGCNAGRNLSFLFEAGFTDLTAIEISKPAIGRFREAFPDVFAATDVHNASVEDVIRDMPSGSFDVVFTMAVLEHIHPDSDWIFGEMVRATRRCIITVEDEVGVSERHFPRNYQHVFERLGMTQKEESAAMGTYGLPPGFVARVFEKRL